MNTNQSQGLLVVRLDNEKFPADGGEVIGHLAYLSEIKRFHDKDGQKPSNLRIWSGKAKIGSRVQAKQFSRAEIPKSSRS